MTLTTFQDSGRSLSRWASDAPEHRSAAAKMLSMYMMTLAGTPYLLAGQEIGMANLSSDYGAEAYIDVEAKRYYDAVLERRGGHESQMGDVLREMQKKARDHGRLPMQWSSEPNAAFTNERATPWMTINKDYIDWNVTSQLGDSQSILSFWKHMISLRKELTDLLVYGSYGSIPEQETGECVLGWRRECHETGQIAVTLLNFSESVQHVPMNDCRSMTIVAENGRVSVSDGGIKLGPYGGVVLLGSI